MLTDAQVSALPSGLYALLVQSRQKKDCDCAERIGINPETGKCRSHSGRPTHFDEAGVLRYPNGLGVPSDAKYCQSCGCYFDKDKQAIVSQHGPLTIEALLAALADATLRAEQTALQPGQVAVDEADLRWALTAIAFIGGLDCEKCVVQGSCLNWKQGAAGDDVTMFNCLQALIAHFGLAPAPDATDA